MDTLRTQSPELLASPWQPTQSVRAGMLRLAGVAAGITMVIASAALVLVFLAGFLA